MEEEGRKVEISPKYQEWKGRRLHINSSLPLGQFFQDVENVPRKWMEMVYLLNVIPVDS